MSQTKYELTMSHCRWNNVSHPARFNGSLQYIHLGNGTTGYRHFTPTSSHLSENVTQTYLLHRGKIKYQSASHLHNESCNMEIQVIQNLHVNFSQVFIQPKNKFWESIPGLHKRLQIRALAGGTTTLFLLGP
jgi:hypothetical protein